MTEKINPPMAHFTLQDLVNFTKNESKMVEDILPAVVPEEEQQPSEAVLRNILDYSKALSVRKSKHSGSYRMILN